MPVKMILSAPEIEQDLHATLPPFLT